MKLATFILAALALFTLPLSAEVGYQTISVPAPHRTQPLDLHIWYPAKDDGTPMPLGKNAVFVGVDVTANATPTSAAHPLVLLSHGSGGKAVNIAWIGAYLANQGMVVVATNHPGTTSGDSIPQETVKIWERPADLSAILDYAQQSLADSLHIDMARIGVVGFSLGGHTALGIGGAQADHSAYIRYCDEYPNLLDCAWYRAAGIDLNKIDTDRFEQSNADRRIKAVVAIDPALAQAYQPQSLAGMTMPVQIINLGAPETVPMGINAMNISKQFPHLDYRTVIDATHFSFLGLCTNIGEMIISGAGEEPICSEVGNRSRENIHLELEKRIGEFLSKSL